MRLWPKLSNMSTGTGTVVSSLLNKFTLLELGKNGIKLCRVVINNNFTI